MKKAILAFGNSKKNAFFKREGVLTYSFSFLFFIFLQRKRKRPEKYSDDEYNKTTRKAGGEEYDSDEFDYGSDNKGFDPLPFSSFPPSPISPSSLSLSTLYSLVVCRKTNGNRLPRLTIHKTRAVTKFEGYSDSRVDDNDSMLCPPFFSVYFASFLPPSLCLPPSPTSLSL